MGRPVGVLIVDECALLRAGVRSVFGDDAELRVVAEAGDARGAYIAGERTLPDVVIVGDALPDEDAIGCLRELRRRVPASRVLMLSASAREDRVVDAFVAGARGYALKQQPPDELRQAVRELAAGGEYRPPGVAADEIARRVAMRRRGLAAGGPLDELSPREREVFELLLRGLTNDSVARQLFVSVKTVETHRMRIFRKLEVHSLAELIRFAAGKHLLPELR